jgi:hypothetical protein
MSSKERAQIAAELRAGVKPAEQIAREHQPLGQLGKRAVILYELGRPLV